MKTCVALAQSHRHPAARLLLEYVKGRSLIWYCVSPKTTAILLDVGVEVVLVTAGSRGIYFGTIDIETGAPAIVHFPAMVVPGHPSQRRPLTTHQACEWGNRISADTKQATQAMLLPTPLVRATRLLVVSSVRLHASGRLIKLWHWDRQRPPSPCTAMGLSRLS